MEINKKKWKGIENNGKELYFSCGVRKNGMKREKWIMNRKLFSVTNKKVVIQ